MRTLIGDLPHNWPLATNMNVFSEGYYRLPVGHRGADVLDSFANSDNQPYGFLLRDGTLAFGPTPSDASADTSNPPLPPLPPGLGWSDLAGAVRDNGYVTTYWKNGQWYRHNDDFTIQSSRNYSTPGPQSPATIEAMAFDLTLGDYWVLYTDGSMSRGTKTKLGKEYWPN